MEDKIVMSTILNGTKGLCDLMMHGSIESSTPDVHQAFCTALDDCLTMQNQIYSKMSAKGWYPMQTVEKTKIDSAIQKFSQPSQG